MASNSKISCTFFLCFFALEVIFCDIQESSTISRVFHEVLDKFLEEQEKQIDIWIFEESTSLSTEVLSDFLAEIDGKFLVKVISYPFLSEEIRIFDHPAIILPLSILHFHLIQRYILLRRDDNQPCKHFVFIPDMSFQQLELSHLIKETRELLIFAGAELFHSFFVIEEVDSVKLATVEWFSEKHCNFGHLRELNSFDKNLMTWNSKLESYEKFMQYYGCELVMLLPLPEENGALHHSSGYGLVSIKDELTLHGLTPVLFEIASKIYNFSAAYQPAIVPSSFMSFPQLEVDLWPLNNTKKTPIVFFEVLGIHMMKKLKHVYSNVIADLKSAICVTPGEAYTPYEKLFLPFDLETWILLLMTFAVAFLVIFIVNRLSKSIQNLVYGHQGKTPALNVVKIFFGISQTRLPERSFARTILILFIFFCLIFRTCFQSKLFDFMTSQPRRPPPKTVEDLIDMNYTVYYYHESNIIGLIQDEKDRRLKVYRLRLNDYHIFFNKYSQIASLRSALIVDEFFQNFYESTRKENYDWNCFSDQNALVSHDVVAFYQFSFYFRMMKKTIDGLIDSGVMKHLVEEHYTKKRKFEKFKEGPKVLTVDDLAFGFNIWLGFCGISVVAFVAEQLWARIKFQVKREEITYAKIHPIEVDESPENPGLKPKKLQMFRIKRQTKNENTMEFEEVQPIETGTYSRACTEDKVLTSGTLKNFRVKSQIPNVDQSNRSRVVVVAEVHNSHQYEDDSDDLFEEVYI